MSFRYRLVCMKHQTLGRVVPRLAQGHLYAGRPGHPLRRQRENLKQPRVDPRRGVGYGACEYACTLQEDPAVYVTGIGESRSCAARSCLIASKGVRSVNLNSSQWMLAAATVAFLAAFALYEHALAIIALDRNAAHLSEQLALKSFVPVLALGDDKTLTSADVPSIFRLPAATPPATALHLLEVAEARSGRNPQQVRNVLASGNPISCLAFLPTGNPRAVTKYQASQWQPNSASQVPILEPGTFPRLIFPLNPQRQLHRPDRSAFACAQQPDAIVC